MSATVRLPTKGCSLGKFAVRDTGNDMRDFLFRQGRMAMRGIERQDDIETNIRVDPVGEQVTGNPGQGIAVLLELPSRYECAIPSPMLQPQRQLSRSQLAIPAGRRAEYHSDDGQPKLSRVVRIYAAKADPRCIRTRP
jgi:hypothetical protein